MVSSMSLNDVLPRYPPPNPPLLEPRATAPANIFESLTNCDVAASRTGPAENGAVPAHTWPDAEPAVINKNESTARRLERRMVGGVERVVSNGPTLPVSAGARNAESCERAVILRDMFAARNQTTESLHAHLVESP